MQAHLQQVEIEPVLTCDDDLAVEHAALGELRLERSDQLREVAIERLLVAALDEDLIAVTEDQRPKAIPLRLEYPAFARWKLADALSEHREDGWIDCEVHQFGMGGWPATHPPACADSQNYFSCPPSIHRRLARTTEVSICLAGMDQYFFSRRSLSPPSRRVNPFRR